MISEKDKASEKIEREALISLHAHCPADTREKLGLHMEHVADGIVCGAKNESSIVINRTLGLGTEIGVAIESIKTVISLYKSWDVLRYFIHLYPDAVSDEAFPSLGLKKGRGWMKFTRDASPPPPARTDLRVEAVGEDRAEDFSRIVCGAFAMTEASIPFLAGIAKDPRWHLFVAYNGKTPAGAGGLFVLGKAAFTEWGATDKAFRRRGSQNAIMAARIQKAIDLGCTQIYTETGEEVEGDLQHSYKNIQKAGFLESVLRRNYIPA